MSNYYLRVEGVNLTHFILDTADLSTVRGGSLLLLSAIKRIQAHLPSLAGVKSVESISLGASSGLFRLTLDPDTDASQIREDLAEHFLRQDGTLSQATFVVDLVRESGDFARDRETLVSLNRHRQMTMPSLAPPGWNIDDQCAPCDFDRLRPGTDSVDRPPRATGEGRRAVTCSPSARIRREFGRDQRERFYRDALEGEYIPPGNADITRFSQELGELAGPPYPPGVPDILHEKIAVIYCDGNKFGRLQREQCRTEKRQQQFDLQLRALRRQLLAALLREIDRDPKSAGWWSADGNRRLETLLWGGDELIWVVPAWQGWRVLELFYERSRCWKVDLVNNQVGIDCHPLTHAGGLVFAHHKAPIHRLTELAHKLADAVKDGLGNRQIAADAPDANRFDYEVLESFDHIGPSLETFRARRLPKTKAGFLVDVSLAGAQTVALRSAFRIIQDPLQEEGAKSPFPTRQLHLAFKRWQTGRPPEDMGMLGQAIREDDLLKGYQIPILKAAEATGPATLWYHLANLWDYVARIPAN